MRLDNSETKRRRNVVAIWFGDGLGQFVTRLFKLDPELPSQLNYIAEAKELLEVTI